MRGKKGTKDIQPIETKPIRLLKAGRIPLLLTTRIVSASAITRTESAKETTVKLLGIIKGVVIAKTPAEISMPALPHRCIKCRSSCFVLRKKRNALSALPPCLPPAKINQSSKTVRIRVGANSARSQTSRKDSKNAACEMPRASSSARYVRQVFFV